MKIIDLLLKIANREEVPNKIKYEDVIFKYDEENKEYYEDSEKYSGYSGGGLFAYKFMNCNEFLNDEVGIIEEPKNIEKIEMYEDEEGHYFLNKQYRKVYVNCVEMDFMVDKFNELIDEINNLKEK